MTESAFKIAIDGRWDLKDLYEFSKNFEQCYFAYTAILEAHEDSVIGKYDNAFSQYPWQGGYSTVNFYRALKRDTSKRGWCQEVSVKVS